MGGVFSSGVDNNDLVNILKLLGYIRTKRVERVFRAVDRGDYVLPSHRVLAYKDLSWKLGNIHLSAPCVYCKVMEGLSLKPGLSFLNIGSGTGYLSTMAGLILGKNGTNHGIEIHEDCIVYAYEHLETFKQKSLDVDSYEFCEPVFQLGNILNVTPNRRYDRVYCGAACPESHETYIKQFVKVGGVLVMPYKDNLLRIQRLDENTWRYHTMLPVSFASLVTPPEGKESGLLQLPLSQPCTLQELCRSSIRCHLRKLVWSEHNDLECKLPLQTLERAHTLAVQRSLDNPFLEESQRLNNIRDRMSAVYNIQPDGQGVVTSTLRLVRAFVRPGDGGDDDDEDEDEDDDDRHEMTTSDDSEDADRAEPGNSAGEATFEAEMREDFLEAVSEARETSEAQDAEMEDREQTTRLASSRPSDSKLKRKSDAIGGSNEPHNSQRYRLDDQSDFHGENSGQAAPATSSNGSPNGAMSDQDGDADADPDADVDADAWLEQAFSILKDKYGMEVNSNSAFDTSDSSSEAAEVAEPPEAAASERADREAAESDSDEENASLFVGLLTMAMQNIATSNPDSRANGSHASLAERISSRENKTDDSEAPEDEDESPRTPEKSDTSSNDSEAAEEADEVATAKLRRGPRTARKRRSDQRSESSACDDSSTETSDSERSDSSDSDTDFDFNVPHEQNASRNIKPIMYARTIRREQITRFMRGKVGRLPLPMPLRLYLNYNREL